MNLSDLQIGDLVNFSGLAVGALFTFLGVRLTNRTNSRDNTVTAYSKFANDVYTLWDGISTRVQAQAEHIREQNDRISALEACERERLCYEDWLISRERAFDSWARREGIVLPGPEFLTFPEWREEFGE